MAEQQNMVQKLRAAGVPEERIAQYIATKDPTINNLVQRGQVPIEQINDYYGRRMSIQSEEVPDFKAADLKPNDTLGLVTGGLRPVNNVLGWGSQALQKMGVPKEEVNAAGRVIRKGISLGQGVPNRDELADLERRAAAAGERPGRLGQAAGGAAMSVPLAVATAPLAPAAGAGGLARLGYMAGEGAIQGAVATENPDDPTAVALDATIGAIANPAAGALNRSIAAAVAPRLSPALQKLVDAGQRKFTPAELTGSRALKKAEDAGRSTLLLGALIEGAQRDATQDFNRVILQQSADAAGIPMKVGTPTRSTYDEMSNAFSGQYDNIYDQAALASDPELLQNAASLRAAGAYLPPEYAAILDGMVTPDQYGNYGGMVGRDLLETDQLLTSQGKKLLNPEGQRPVLPSEYTAAKELATARRSLRDAMGRQDPARKEAADANRKGYAMFRRAMEASTRAGMDLDPGQFSTEAYRSAILKSVGNNQKVTLGSRGKIPGQELAEAGVEVMGNRVPDSGTAFRTALGKIAGSGAEAGAGLTALANPAAVLPLLSLYAAYSPPGRALLSRAATAPRSEAVKLTRELLARRGINEATRSIAAPAAVQASDANRSLEERLNER